MKEQNLNLASLEFFVCTWAIDFDCMHLKYNGVHSRKFYDIQNRKTLKTFDFIFIFHYFVKRQWHVRANNQFTDTIQDWETWNSWPWCNLSIFALTIFPTPSSVKSPPTSLLPAWKQNHIMLVVVVLLRFNYIRSYDISHSVLTEIFSNVVSRSLKIVNVWSDLLLLAIFNYLFRLTIFPTPIWPWLPSMKFPLAWKQKRCVLHSGDPFLYYKNIGSYQL